MLCVNLTHLDDECPDDECTISNAEYAFVKAGYPTVVAFSRAKIWDANKIEGCLKNGLFPKPYQGDIPHQTIDKIAKAALDSKELSAKAKSLIR